MDKFHSDEVKSIENNKVANHSGKYFFYFSTFFDSLETMIEFSKLSFVLAKMVIKLFFSPRAINLKKIFSI